MFEPQFTFSPTSINNEDNFFAFAETPCVDDGVAAQFIKQKPAPLKIAPKDFYQANLLISPVHKELDGGFLQLLDDNFAGSSVDFLMTPPAPQQAEQFLPIAPEPVEKKKRATQAAKPKSAAPLNPERNFKTVYVNKEIVQNGEITLKMKTRRDQPNEAIPERLYNSIKYNIIQSANGFPENLPFVLARIRAVDAETLELVKKNNKDVLKGTVEAALTKPPRSNSNQFEGQLYVQFTEVSYHVDKREYCFEVSYFTPEDLENPILIKRSAPFKTFARKPNKKRPKNGDKSKNKKQESDDEADDSEEELIEPAPKKQKNSANYDVFVSKAEELFEFNKKLGEEERKKAMALVIQKFHQIDPVFTSTVLFPSAANSFLSFAPMQQNSAGMKF